MYGQGAKISPFKLNNLVNEHFPQLILKVFFRVKTSEVEEIVFEKW